MSAWSGLKGASRRALALLPTLALLLTPSLSGAGEQTVQYAGHVWRVEQEGADADLTVRVSGGDLVMDTPRGLTVWLATPLRGHYEIRYTRMVVDRGGPNDRLSDVNQFWLANTADASPVSAASVAAATASATARANLPAKRSSIDTGVLGRSGRLADYDALSMYYFGFGGNDNTTTRFRRYDGTASRPLLQEYLSADRLLRANHRYRIRTIVDAQGTRVYIDGTRYFSDAAPVPGNGYFAFRTTKSHQIISAFHIRRLR